MNIMYCVDVPLHAASVLFMFTLPPKRGTTRKQKLIKKGQFFAVSTSQLSVQAVSGRECPLCRKRHLSNILKYFLGYRSRTRTPNPITDLNPNPNSNPNRTLKIKENKTTPE